MEVMKNNIEIYRSAYSNTRSLMKMYLKPVASKEKSE